MRKLFFVCFLTILGAAARADQTYQMSSAVGLWKSVNGVFSYYDVLITASADGQSLVLTNCTLDIEVSGNCVKYNELTGSGVYLAAQDGIQVTEPAESSTPEYLIQVNPQDPSKMLRTWESRTIVYRKVR